jgi:hypothetical protein
MGAKGKDSKKDCGGEVKALDSARTGHWKRPLFGWRCGSTTTVGGDLC